MTQLEDLERRWCSGGSLERTAAGKSKGKGGAWGRVVREEERTWGQSDREQVEPMSRSGYTEPLEGQR